MWSLEQFTWRVAISIGMLVGGATPCLSIAKDKDSSDPPPLFNPERHMRLSEVRPGMQGYGLTVFSGSKIERFDVEVVSILHNFNPKFDVVLIRCLGERMKQTGPVAGMSGSPIFLRDDQGKERMVGAFAYGWPLMKEPIAGVQPIEYMLSLPVDVKSAEEGGTTASKQTDAPKPPRAQGNLRWSLTDIIPTPLDRTAPPASFPFARWGSLEPNPRLLSGTGGNSTQLAPLTTPLMSGGLSADLVEQFSPIFRAYGLTLLQSGGGGSKFSALGGDGDEKSAAPIEPGSVLAAPLLTGDVDLTAVGTCTEVLGERFVGFGHSFNNEGRITLPVASGEIQAIIAKLDQSFKLGSATKLRGAITNDQVMGVGGRLGQAPAAVPIDVHVSYTDGSSDRRYHFDSALHPRLTPLLTVVALSAAIGSARDLPQYHTVEYSMKMEFANGRSVDLTNVAVNVNPGRLFMELALPIMAAAENPFERVPVSKVSGTVRIVPEAHQAQILSVNVPKVKFRPGETVKAYLTIRPFRAPEVILPLELELPRDLPGGQYQLVVSDSQRYFADELRSQPFRFSAENADEVFSVIRDFTSIRHDAVYLRLIRQADGVAVGRVAMPRLPSSRRQVLLGAGRSNTTAFVSSSVKSMKTDYVLEGGADFVITIDSEAHVEVGGAPGRGVEKVERPANTPPQTAVNPTEEKEKDKDKPKGDQSEKDPQPSEPR